MLANELHCHLAAAFVRNIDELGTGFFFDGHGNDLVLLLGPRTTHFHFAGPSRFYRIDIFFHRLVRRFCVYPENELVKRHHLYGRQVFPAERHARCQRRGEQVRQGDNDFMRITLGTLDVEKSFRACTTAFVDHHHRLLHQIVFGHHTLYESRHLVCATTGSRWNNEFNGLGRLPSVGSCCYAECHCHRCRNFRRDRKTFITNHDLLLRLI